MVKTYIYLIGAIFFEVAVQCFSVSQNFTKLIPTVLLSIFLSFNILSFNFCSNKLPIAIVYASWSGLGIFSIAILGYVFNQTLSYQAIMGLFLIILGVTLVNILDLH